MTETQTLTLTEFLLAGIAEDEAKVAEDDYSTFGMRGGIGDIADERGGSPYLTITPARVLAECEAKRRIVEEYETAELALTQPAWSDRIARERMTTCRDVLLGTLRILASVYADRPGYRDGVAAMSRRPLGPRGGSRAGG